ncbi:chemotaxis protein CheR [Vibrio sp. 10N.286.49.B3]|uniref:CheR family methyltransferase n=1 Tax=Vibrio sp. 10N.286.49.B3 TaxID=1880855 RepID=UPI000C82A2CF|nr:CheR family methyltransferase [Vibrio sp. 10N.286.49.B3]PMH41406.1 chemotaxis protein CheR [Vibrio sp. 10N.286.49.B3]
MELNTPFLFTEQDFKMIANLIYSEIGVSLHENKKNLVYNRLIGRLRAKKLDSFEAYLEQLQDRDSPEWACFINALTTNLTYFFRESYHFDLLADHMKTNFLTRSRSKPLKIWCSACSTGEEAYSIAMTMIEAFGTMSPPVKILATDINSDVLRTAKEGCYSTGQLGSVSNEQLHRFFLKKTNNGTFEVKPEVKALISFKPLNLIDQKWPMKKKFDVIFCRNVLIYFDKITQEKLLSKFARYEDKGSLLFLGHSETFSHQQTDFKLLCKTMYKRI